MKFITFAAALVSTCALFAQAPAVGSTQSTRPLGANLTPEESARRAAGKGMANKTPEELAAAKERRRRRTGGMIHTGTKGNVVYVNCKKAAPVEAVKEVSDLFSKNLRCNFSTIESEDSFALSSVTSAVEKSGGNAAIFIMSDPVLPLSLVALEGRWALVNAAAASVDKPTPEVFKLRIQKLLIRVSTVLLGGANSEFQISAMQSVSSLEELDKMTGKGVDPRATMGMMRHLPRIGVVQDSFTTYRRACEQGWAPPPTNEYQRAVWEQIKGKGAPSK